MNFIWEENHPPLHNNEVNSLGRLHSLTKNLIRSNKLGEYDKIIQEQKMKVSLKRWEKLKHLRRGKNFICPIDL